MSTTEWEVSAEEVRALASHRTPAASPDPVYQRDLRAISDDDIDAWISEVSAVVDIRLRRRSRLATGNRARLVAAGKTVVKVGAAAYLVDAAAPTRAGVADNASYGQVLWTRYQSELEELAEALEEWIADGGDDDSGTAKSAGGAASFPEPKITDDMGW
ncbi:hypothetical protein [Zhihengliuella halotolerans]|uniref:hypothetical protein n=1 Tax=Zhihengliuella halotolerans TaxID=370736 RepID=UPI000C8024E5|nr:hypothetical protein [Zhihengliuella halotolerans]